MINRNPLHKEQADKLQQIFKDKQFVCEGDVYALDVQRTQTHNRMMRVRPKDHIRYLVTTELDTGAHRVFASDKCQTIERPLTIAEANPPTGFKVEEPTPIAVAEATPPASIEADEDVIIPIPKKKIAKVKEPVVKKSKKK